MSRDIHNMNPSRGIRPEDYIDGSEPPSEKQLAYAESLARKYGVLLPEAARVGRGACGAFISEWKR